MNNRIAVEIIHGGHEAILELLLGCDADVAQDGAGEFGKEALDEIEPGAMPGSESEFKAVRPLTGEPGSGLFGDMRGMIVEDQLDCRLGRIGGVEQLEEFDEFAAAMPILDQRMDLAGDRSMPASKLTVPWRLYSCSRAKVAWTPGPGGKSGAVVAIAWIPGFSS